MADNTDDTRFTRFNYKLVSVGLGTNNIILIDVRDIAKRLNNGRIPGSLHVPCTLMSRLSTNYETFKFLKINIIFIVKEISLQLKLLNSNSK